MFGHHLAEVVETGQSQCCNGRGLTCLICPWFHSSPLLGTKSVTVGNSPIAPGTLGSYQILDWAMLANAGVVTTDRNHIYHLIHNIYCDVISSQHMVHGMVMVHDAISAVHQVDHLMASQNRITCQLQMSTTSNPSTTSTAPLGMKKNKKSVSVRGFS